MMTELEPRQLLLDLDTALTDWVRQFAPDLCHLERLEESLARIIRHVGTLAYIAGLRQRIKETTTNDE